MKNFFKKTTCFLLAFLLFAGIALFDPSAAKAADLYASSDIMEATAGTPVSHSFTVPTGERIYFELYIPSQTNCTFTIYNSSNSYVDSYTLAANDPSWEYVSKFSSYYNYVSYDFTSGGDYTLELTFDESTQYLLFISEAEAELVLSNTNLTLTAGFSKKLSVTNATGAVTWSSSNTSVATVSNDGTVKAKKAGSATITAAVDGQTLTCAVKVKKNVYKAPKVQNSQVPSGEATWEAYNASYNSNGDLVIKCRIANNSGHNIEYLKNLSVKVKAANGKTIGTYKVGRVNMTVANHGAKNFNVTIKKSALKIKKADLRNAKITTNGKYGYTYYTYY